MQDGMVLPAPCRFVRRGSLRSPPRCIFRGVSPPRFNGVTFPAITISGHMIGNQVYIVAAWLACHIEIYHAMSVLSRIKVLICAKNSAEHHSRTYEVGKFVDIRTCLPIGNEVEAGNSLAEEQRMCECGCYGKLNAIAGFSPCRTTGSLWT